jgi:acyl transferase domain-containing protein
LLDDRCNRRESSPFHLISWSFYSQAETLQNQNMSNAEPIAIIGSGCRFPGGANSPAKLWELLQHPRDVSAKVPRERFNLDGFYDQDPRNPGTTNSSQSYFLDERVDEFDAAFFNISQNEAESMDPQQRLMLETVYEALESAGLRMEDLHGSQTGIYCGVMCDDYRSLAFQDLGGLPPHAATGTSAALLSNRVSYFYGWRGPSITVDTACSSSLVAVHLAAQALSQGDCNVALAAGANLILSPNVHVSESNLNMLSPTGHCHMWDIQADGYARGEGVAAVVLKRLGNAIADGDYIESVIRATGVNQDGRTNGITMPSSQAQSDLIIRTYQRAGLDPVNRPDDRCQYFEAHGTGTPVGDPQEARAIHDAFFSRSPALAQKNLYVGSIKTLIGHTEGTAGLAGLLKASLAVHHAMIPPNLHFHTLNPDIAPYARSLHIPIDLVPWPKMTSEKPRRASVNSFGFGGTNAHVIVESYGPQPSESTSSQGSNSSESVTLPFVFSAGSERALRALLSRYHDFLDESSGAILIQDLAWSLWERRSSLRSRLCICTSSIENLKVQISEHVKEGFSKFTLASRSSSQKNKIIGIFTGQGAQWAQMGLKLIETYPMAKHWLNELQQFLDSLPGEYGGQSFSLATEIAASTNKTRMNQALVSQPVTTAVQIILVQLLQAMAIQLDVVVGHSSGEIAASYAAGFLSASDCIRIAFLRGQFSHTAAMDKSQRGAMLAVGMTHDEAETLCSKAQWMGRVNVAAYNSPTSITLSGDEDAIQELSALLQAAGTFARTLKVDMAYHSHHMSACADKYAAALESCQIRPLQQRSSTSWWSSVHGDHLMTGDDRDDIQSNYWVRNLVSPVRFNQAVIAATHHHKLNLAIEIGPHPALKGPFQQSSDDLTIPYTGTLQRGADDIRSIASMIATCWRYLGSQCWNIKPYIQGLFPARELSHVQEMPLYPFDHLNRYWIKSQRINATLHPKQPQTHLLGALSPDCMEGEWRWRNHFRLQEFSWLLQNVHQPGINLPIAGYVGMVLQAGYVAVSDRLVRFLEIADLSIQQQIAFDTDGRVETMASAKITAQDETTTQLHFTCSYSTDGTLKPCASALLIITHAVSASTSLPARLMDCTGMISSNPNKFYAELDRLGYHGTCRGIDNFTLEGQVVHGMITSGDSISLGSDLLWHPQVLESAIQGLLLAIFDDNPRGLAGILQCTGIQRILINPKMLLHEETSARFIAAVQDTAGYPVIGDIDIFDQAGHAMMQVEEISLTVSNKQFIQKSQSLFSGLYWGPLNPKPLFHSTEIDQREHISMAAQQVFFRYPQAKALELETTDKEHVYKTVAHESLGCLYSADTQSSPSCHETHSGSRKLDLDQDPADQAFLQQTYDLVILSSDSKSQVSLIQSLTRLRKLLKSGGYLLIHARPRPAIPQEPQSTFCQEKKPTISLGQLDLNLRQSRFSGIGTSLDQNSSSEWHNYVIVSQAVDETVQLLLEPLPAAKKNAIQRPLYIISDEASSASETIKSLELLLGDCFQVVLTLTRQQLLQTKPQAQNSCVLYFGDPEQLYSQIDGNEVDNVSEQIARGSSHLLCVTETDQPHLQGITRSNLHGLSKYNTSLRFQHLSINAGGSIPTIVIAECLLRLIQCPWANSYDMKTHLWTTEPRLHWEKGQFQIPRLKPAVARNERAIAEHQDLYQLVNPQQESVRLISSPTSRHFIRSPVKPTEKGVTQIKVELSSLSALPLSKSISLYLVMGIEIKSGRKVVALSKENGSVIPTPVEWVHQHEDQEDISQEDSFNRLIMSFLSIFIVDQADPHSTMVVHESDALLRGYITSYGKQRCVSPFFTNSTLDPQSTDRFIHPMTSNRDLQRILPNNVSFILRCRAKSWDIFSRVRLASCPSVTVASVHTLCTPNSQLNEVKNSLSSVKQILELANILSKDQPSPELRTNALPVITPQQIQNGTMSDGSLAVIDWTPFAPVQVLVQKASAQLSFSPHRLYLLAGLPEQIGRWITEFIVEGGARNIVLATHKIAAEQGWVKRMHERGVNLRTMLTYVLSLPQTPSEKCIMVKANHMFFIAVVIPPEVPRITRYIKSSTRNLKW